ncbi:MAG: pyridoxal phosphate-dependent aminotransferase [Acidobacteriota bacterium]|nr:pyridoxal phosphate-dependent aminotransferase [Acidobacteriota bacterium]
MTLKSNFSPYSRRTFLRASAIAAAVTGMRIVTEPMLAHADRPVKTAGGVMIDANENPLGPSADARDAVSAIIPQGGRYLDGLTKDLINTFAKLEGLKPEYVKTYPGSSEPLHFSVITFTSDKKSYVTADPGYEAGMFAAAVSGARIVKVPLTKSYAHDVKAMLAAAPDAGVFYICSPNNPTGTLTNHSDIEYLVENKPKGSIVLVDEAYIHFSEGESAIDLVKSDKDVIVLRTFSKLYGMAGLRCGFAIARPNLLAKLENYIGWNAMPVTALVAAMASLKEPQLVKDRKRANAQVRESVFHWLDQNGYSYIPSQSNCFMLDTKRNAKDVIAAMAKQNVFIGRIWPVMPTYTRITIGTAREMETFQTAYKKVISNVVTSRVELPTRKVRCLDGLTLPA